MYPAASLVYKTSKHFSKILNCHNWISRVLVRILRTFRSIFIQRFSFFFICPLASSCPEVNICWDPLTPCEQKIYISVTSNKMNSLSYIWRSIKVWYTSENTLFQAPGRPKVSHFRCSLRPPPKIFLVLNVNDKSLIFRVQDALLEDFEHWWNIHFETPAMTKNKI